MKAYNLFIQKDKSPDPECTYVLIGSHDPEDGMGGAVAHVFGDDEVAAEKLAREILDKMSVTNGGESGVLEVNEYQVMGGGPGDVVDLRIQRRRQLDGSSKWAVVERGAVLNRQGEWEREPIPSSRDPFFLTRCRFDSVEEALQCWQTAVVRSVYGKSLDVSGADKADKLEQAR